MMENNTENYRKVEKEVHAEIHTELHKKRRLSTTRTIVLGFAAAILIGALILMLPISSAAGTWTNPIDALFTATTSVCVTGLVTVTTAVHWNIFGQAVILLLAQLGGLGVITVATIVFILLGKRITLKNRMLIRETYNTDTMTGLAKLIIKIVKATFIIEGIGAVFYAIVYIPRFGAAAGIWKAVFNSVSAFCNAGMDIVGESSLRVYAYNPIINITTMVLIVLGGLGFIVWWNLIDAWKQHRHSKRKMISALSIHTRLVLCMTLVLIAGGAVLIFLFERNNGATIGAMPLPQKIMAATFQSVTTRTAGFETIPQAAMTNGSTLLTMLLMLIGGSPAGTAGGVKTTTIGILLLVVYCSAKGKKDTEFRGRRISSETVKTALTVIVIAVLVVMTASIILFATEDAGFADVLFEVISAMGTVGLTRGITPALSVIGKLTIICVMFIGRIGPVSMAMALMLRNRDAKSKRTLPEGRILIG